MGKQGPCYHCGVTSTPLWRNGPPEKPVLCNACGSRWRTKGTLVNYTPLHARAEPDDLEDYRNSRVKTISVKNKEAKVLKRKPNHEIEVGAFSPDYNHGFRKGLDEDTSNRSSSGSAISNSESCAQFGSADASDLTGPAQPMVWDSMVPSRKRTCVTRAKPSPVEKLTKDLYTILHEHSPYFSGSSEEDLLFESDKPMVSVEIGHGSVLIRHPSSIAREEESEASSLSVDNKLHPVNEAYSRLTTFSVHTDNKGVNLPNPGAEKVKKPTVQGGEQEQIKWDKDQLEKLQLLGHHSSPLRYVDLKDLLNFGEFVSCLTKEEHQQLLKYLPSIDTSGPPESLRNMFDSIQFEENLSSFQKLLAEGVFDNTLLGVKTEDCRTLKKFVLCNLTKSKWVGQYNLLKDVKCRSSISMSEVGGEFDAVATGHSVNAKRSRDGQYQKFPAKTIMKSPKRVMMKASYEHREVTDNDGSCFSPRSLFALPADNSSLVLDSFNTAESSDQDLLLDVPSNSSFPQAELLLPTSSFGAQASTCSSSGYPQLLHP
ncbi:GATA transcription factor 26-like isoform X2 [Coffea arabica]|uniref:GATA transcription factor 26-like isoform X2 n=1 Tax=Coffea arabica TaxID=13443 RepID=A0ABM4VIS3_COFAR